MQCKTTKNNLNKIFKISLDKEFEHKSFYNFQTEHSEDFKIELIQKLNECINRKKSIKKIQKYVNYFMLAEQIEAGIFEFTLIHVTINKIISCLAPSIYESKLYDICINLDINNKKINNKTLLNTVKKMHVKPFYVAFLSPEQIHPENWAETLKKIDQQHELSNHIISTDLYKCYKCGERKSKTSQMQTRSADEPMTIFVTCLVCYNTFTK